MYDQIYTKWYSENGNKVLCYYPSLWVQNKGTYYFGTVLENGEVKHDEVSYSSDLWDLTDLLDFLNGKELIRCEY